MFEISKTPLHEGKNNYLREAEKELCHHWISDIRRKERREGGKVRERERKEERESTLGMFCYANI